MEKPEKQVVHLAKEVGRDVPLINGQAVPGTHSLAATREQENDRVGEERLSREHAVKVGNDALQTRPKALVQSAFVLDRFGLLCAN